MKNIILSVNNIKKTFDGTQALKGINIDIIEGEIHAIVGENGAGKSTLMKLIIGELRCDYGSIIFDKIDITNKEPSVMNELGMQLVHQDLNLVPSMTVWENIILGCPKCKGKIFLDKKRNYNYALKILNTINKSLDVKEIVKKLSTSEQQIVVFARSVINNPKLLILDEPTARLGLEEAQKLFEIVKSLNKRGVTIIYITHRLDEIYALCNRVTVLRDGENIITEEIKKLNKNDLIQHMIGKKLINYENIKKERNEKIVLELNNIHYDNKVNGISFKLYKGEILGLIGAVGSGKSEILKIIFGAIRPTKGSVIINENKSYWNPKKAIENGIAFIPEDRRNEGLIDDFSIAENITITELDKNFRNKLIRNNIEVQIANNIISKLDIKPANPYLSVKNLSGGNAQKVVIGKWLVGNKNLFLMDEVTAGIDVGVKVEVYKIIENLARDGASVLISTSDIDEALRICHRIIIIFKGTIMATRENNNISKSEILSYIMGQKE